MCPSTQLLKSEAQGSIPLSFSLSTMSSQFDFRNISQILPAYILHLCWQWQSDPHNLPPPLLSSPLPLPFLLSSPSQAGFSKAQIPQLHSLRETTSFSACSHIPKSLGLHRHTRSSVVSFQSSCQFPCLLSEVYSYLEGSTHQRYCKYLLPARILPELL